MSATVLGGHVRGLDARQRCRGDRRCAASGALLLAPGLDGIACRKGHKYMTVVYDISKRSKRLLWIGEKPNQRHHQTVLHVLRKRPMIVHAARLHRHVARLYLRGLNLSNRRCIHMPGCTLQP